MTHNINESPALVRCLDGVGCIAINNDDLLDACLSFRERLQTLIYRTEGFNARQRQFNSNIRVRRTDEGFMVGATKVHYFTKNPNELAWTKKLEERFMAISGEFSPETEHHTNQWLTAEPVLFDRDYEFLSSELSVKEKLKNFHGLYFKKQEKDETFDPKDIYTIYGVRLTHFMQEKLRSSIFEDNYKLHRSKYQSKRQNNQCAAQQLIMHVGDRIAELKKTHRFGIIPIIEICEVWFPSLLDHQRDLRQKERDRRWPKFVASCPCEACKTVLPYLITYTGALESQFSDIYRKILTDFLRKKGWDISALRSLGLH